MSKPDYLDQLIEKASSVAGSDYKLAKELEVNRATISQWRSGKRTCPPEEVALMAKIAGMDPEAWASRALVAKHAGTPKGEKLAVALGKAVLATGVALATVGHCSAPATEYFINSLTASLHGGNPHTPRGFALIYAIR